MCALSCAAQHVVSCQMTQRQALAVSLGASIVLALLAIFIVFAKSLSPAADKPAPYFELRLNDLRPGDLKFFEYNDKPYALIRTSEEVLNDLDATTQWTWSGRAVPRSAFFVVTLISTHRGCGLVHAPKEAPRYAPEREWPGGFFDPCHFGDWDYAGRALKIAQDQDPTYKLRDLEVPRVQLRGSSTIRVLPHNGDN